MMVSQQVLMIEGRQAKYWIGSSGTPLVLVHGNLGDARQHWQPSFQTLSPYFKIVAPELPGFGVSAPLPMPSYQSYLSWLQLLFDMLNLGGPLLMMGHSLGATLSRLYAAENTGYVSRLVLIAGGAVIDTTGCLKPVIRLPGLSAPFLSLARRQAYSFAGLKRSIHDESLLTPEFVAKAQAAADGWTATLRQVASATPPTLRTPTCPTLVMWGQQDRVTPVENGQKVATEISGARFDVIDRAAHLPQIEQPDEFHRRVLPFLRGR